MLVITCSSCRLGRNSIYCTKVGPIVVQGSPQDPARRAFVQPFSAHASLVSTRDYLVPLVYNKDVRHATPLGRLLMGIHSAARK